jgi:hypothetical protein
MLSDLLQAHDLPMIGLAVLLSVALTQGALLLAPRGQVAAGRKTWARTILAGLTWRKPRPQTSVPAIMVPSTPARS